MVTSFSPLEAFLYTNGLARFASVKYSTDRRHASDKLMHLTNTALQQDTDGPPNPCTRDGLNKCDLAELQGLLGGLGVSWGTLWPRVADTVLKALVRRGGPWACGGGGGSDRGATHPKRRCTAGGANVVVRVFLSNISISCAGGGEGNSKNSQTTPATTSTTLNTPTTGRR